MAKFSPEEQLEEHRLISLYKQTGDLEIVGKLFKKYMHLVYGVCLKYFRNREQAQDAVMQIFEKLIKVLGDHEVTNFKSWLYVLSKNHCLMQLRSKEYRRQISTKDVMGVVENTIIVHHNNEPALEDNLTRLEQCIEKLHLEQKRCVHLFYLENKSYKEIEVITKFGLKKVKSHIQNGKRNLKTCMERRE